MFKKTAIAALVLGFSGAASAAMYAPAPAPSCAAGNVTIPCERNAWDLGIDALYQRPEISSVLASNDDFRAKYGWGFRLEGSYHFGTGNDVSLNWSHIKRTEDNVLILDTSTNVEAKMDMVNFEFGQMVNFGESVSTRFHGGLQYLSFTGKATQASTAEHKVTGFGPRAGLMTKYDFGNGFGVYGDLAAAMLLGKETTTNLNDQHATMVSTDANVGVSYTHAMAQGDLTTRLAWGVKQYSFSNSVDGWDGFTLGLKWVGNA